MNGAMSNNCSRQRKVGTVNDNINSEQKLLERQPLVIDDVIYGRITIPSDIAAIIATPQFQRTKLIKQLGFLQFTNSDGEHNEYEHNRYGHCVGAYHATSIMLDALEKNTEWLRHKKIPELYRKSVQIAALLRDIGHFPYSFAWKYVKSYHPKYQAIDCVEAIFQQIDQELFPELRSNSNYGIRLIKALIEGDKSIELEEKYEFIFQIINHKLDVFIWDYLRRDHYYMKHLWQQDLKDFKDIFLNAKLPNDDDDDNFNSGLIQYRYEDKSILYDFYAIRHKFRKHFYKSAQSALSESILRLAVEEIKPKINNIPVEEISAKHNMQEFLQFNDENLLKLLENSHFIDFLQPTTKFEKVDQLPSVTTQCTVTIKKGMYLFNSNYINYYGDEDKQYFDKDDNIKKTKFLYRCYCDPSTKTVFYTVD